MRELEGRAGRTRAQGYQPAPHPRTAGRIAGGARAWLLALLALATAGLGAESRAESLRILMLGDSLTAGYGLPFRDGLPARLEAALRERGLDARVIDAGVSGDTTAGGLARLEWALTDRPHAVIVALGANDALRAIDPAVARSNLDRLLGALSERGLPVLLAGMLAPAQPRSGVRGALRRRSTRSSPNGTMRSSIRSCWTAWPRCPRSTRRTACTRTRRGWR